MTKVTRARVDRAACPRPRTLGVLGACALALWPAHATAGAVTAKTAPPPPPAAKATLHVTPGALGTPWTFELTNTDTTPLRMVADGRLLTLDVTPGDDDKHPKKHATVHCALPADVRPTTDSDGVTVLEPDATYVEEFDPRLYCFDGRGAAALAPGATVVAHLGWPGSHGRTPPFVADESLGGDDRAGLKEVVAEPVVTPDRLGEDTDDRRPHLISLAVPGRVDAEESRDATVEVVVENTSSRTVRMMLRPENLVFDIASTKGTYRCSHHGYAATPIAEVFTTIAPHAKASTSVQLASLCPDGALRQAGLYTVHARLDTRQASGASIGIESFDGVADAAAPMLVRIRHSTAAVTEVTSFGSGRAASGGGAHPAVNPSPRMPIRRPGGHR
jgi:hypothetical protein